MNRKFAWIFALAVLFASCQTPSHLNSLIRKGKDNEAQAMYISMNDPKTKDSKGNSPLHVAAEIGNSQMCEFMIRAGVPVDEKNNDGETPLSLALKNGNSNAAVALLKKNAKITNVNEENVSAQEYFLNDDNLIEKCVNANVTIYPVTAKGDEKSIRDYAYFEDALRLRNVNLRFDNGRTPLHFATERGHTEIVKYLLRKGAELDAVDINGNTPLHFALKTGDIEMTLMLLDYGADANVRDKNGCNSLFYVMIPRNSNNAKAELSKKLNEKNITLPYLRRERGLLDFVSENKIALSQTDMYDIILAGKIDLNVKDKDGNTPLHYVVEKKLPLEILQRLVIDGANIKERNKSGSTALALAVENQLVEHAKYLVSMGADIYSEDLIGYSPVIEAFASGAPGLVEAVINAHTIDLRNRNGDTPMHIAVDIKASNQILDYLHRCGGDAGINAQNLKGNTPLHEAIRTHNQIAGEKLIAWNANIFIENTSSQSALKAALEDGEETMGWFVCPKVVSAYDSSGNTALHFASAWKNKAAVKKLIEKGAKVDSKNYNGETPLFFAMTADSSEVLKILEENGADVNARDKLGNSALHAGVFAGAMSGTETLLALAADKEAQNLAGKTPLAEAAGRNRRNLLELYIKKGANVNASDARGSTILIDSVKTRNYDNAKILLQNGATADLQAIDGRSAYHEAVLSGNIEMTKLIRDASSNPYCNDNQGKSPLSLAFETREPPIIDATLPNDLNSADSHGNTPVHIAINEKVDNAIFKQVIKKGYSLDRRNKDGVTALLLAIKTATDDYQKAEILLENRADPFIATDDGESAVSLAMKTQSPILNKIIETASGKKDSANETLLHYAAKYGNPTIVEKLVDYGYSMSDRNVSGETPLDVARRWDHESFFQNRLRSH